MTLLRPFGGHLPRNEQQLQDLFASLRGDEHTSEEAPGITASALQGLFVRSLSGTFTIRPDRDQDGTHPVARSTLRTRYEQVVAAAASGSRQPLVFSYIRPFSARAAGAAAPPASRDAQPHGYQPPPNQPAI